MTETNLDFGSVIAVSETPQKVIFNYEVGQADQERGSFINEGTGIIFIGWNTASVVPDTSAGVNKNFIRMNDAIRVPQSAKWAILACAAGQSATLQYTED